MLEPAFEIRLELRPVLVQLGDIRGALEHLLEAEALAERLNDEHRRGRVCAFMTNIHTLLGKLDEALASGSRGLEIAARLGDLRLRLLTTSYLEQPHYFLGDYERVIELATDTLAALPAEWVYEYFGVAAPVSVYNRVWIVMSLAELGRFAESAKYEAEAIRLAEPTQHPYTIGLAYLAAGTLHLLEADWVKARPLIERWTAVVRAGNVGHLLPRAVASSAWVLALLGETSEALDRLREGEQLVERQAASGIGYGHGWAYHRLGRARTTEFYVGAGKDNLRGFECDLSRLDDDRLAGRGLDRDLVSRVFHFNCLTGFSLDPDLLLATRIIHQDFVLTLGANQLFVFCRALAR